MLDKLKAIYGDNLLLNTKTTSPQDYLWFQTQDGTPFAIRKYVVTDNEKKLLTLTFKPFNAYLEADYNEAEHVWSSLLFGETPIVEDQLQLSYYQFIHFHCKQTVLEKDVFNEALLGFFPATSIVLWSTNQDGIIILGDLMEQDFSFPDIIDSMASDFYIDLFLYIGLREPVNQNIRENYQLQKRLFTYSQYIAPKRKVFYHQLSLPVNLIIHWVKNNIQTNMNQLIELISNEDDDLLTSIEAFFDSNMNISIASKKLYVHRNSLQYRIEKFHEKTGLNPKEFQDAITIHLLILYKKFTGIIKDVQKT